MELTTGLPFLLKTCFFVVVFFKRVQLKEMCRRELDKAESEIKKNSSIIGDYKQICSQLSERLEKQQTANKVEIEKIRVRLLD